MPPKILITSLGSIGRRHLKNVLSLLDKPIVGLLRRNEKKDELIEGVDEIFTSLEDTEIFDPDCVILASPASEHSKQFSFYQELNKPIFVEKPLGMNFLDVSNLKSDSKNFQLVGYILRFHSTLKKIKDLIDQKIFGNVLLAHIEVGQYLPDWRPDSDYSEGVSARKNLGGGVLLELSHEIDYCTWLFGFPDQLFCSSSKVSDLKIDVNDNAFIIFEYSDNKKISIHLDFLQRSPSMNIKIVFEKANLESNLIDRKIRITNSETDENIQHEFPRDANEDYLRQFDFFFYKCLKKYKPMFESTKSFNEFVDLEHAKRIMHIIDKCEVSSIDGSKIKLPEYI